MLVRDIPADSDHPPSRAAAGRDLLCGNLQVALMRLDVQVGWLKQTAPGETERLAELRERIGELGAYSCFVELTRWAF